MVLSMLTGEDCCGQCCAVEYFRKLIVTGLEPFAPMHDGICFGDFDHVRDYIIAAFYLLWHNFMNLKVGIPIETVNQLCWC